MTLLLETPFQVAVSSPPDQPNMLTTTLAYLEAAFNDLALDGGFRQIIRQPECELMVALPILRDDGTLTVYTGYRVQHSSARGPCKGGIRFRPRY